MVMIEECFLMIDVVDLMDDGDYKVYVVIDGCVFLEFDFINVIVYFILNIEVFFNSFVCRGDNICLFVFLIDGVEYKWSVDGFEFSFFI